MKLLRDLRAQQENQAYLCNDAEAIVKYKFDGPFKCGCRRWMGAGLVSIDFYPSAEYAAGYSSSKRYQESALVFIKSITPIENEIWEFQESGWNS